MNMATRRSSRVTKNNEKKEREQQLDSQVRSGTPDGLVLMDAGEMGRGVATLRKYKEGDLVCIYEGTLVPHKEAVRRYKKGYFSSFYTTLSPIGTAAQKRVHCLV